MIPLNPSQDGNVKIKRHTPTKDKTKTKLFVALFMSEIKQQLVMFYQL